MPDQASDTFLATCIAVADGGEDAFVDAFAEASLPALRAMRDEGRIADHHLFQQLYSIADEDHLPPWPFLQLVRLRADGAAGIEATANRICALIKDVPNATIKHVELAQSVPGADLPSPAADSPFAPADVKYKIEYIQVYEAFRTAYHDIIETWDGPMKTRLIEQHFMFNFIGLETDRVVESAAGIAPWNVMHVMGLDDPEKVNRFSSVYDDTLNSLQPSSDYESVFGDLPKMRIKLRHIIGRLRPELLLA